MNAFPIAQEHGDDGNRADAPAPGRARGNYGPDERREATNSCNHTEDCRAQTELVEDEQEPGRTEDAPECGHRHLRSRERAKDRVVDHHPKAFPDLAEDGLPVCLGRRWAFGLADRAEKDRR